MPSLIICPQFVPTSVSYLLLGTYSEVSLISSLTLDTVSIVFVTPLPIRTNNLYYQLYTVLTVQYYTWYRWVCGLSSLHHVHKKTKNFSKWTCSCIQLKGTYSVTWTLQSFCQTQINSCLPIISSDSNTLFQFLKHCSKHSHQMVLGIYVIIHRT